MVRPALRQVQIFFFFLCFNKWAALRSAITATSVFDNLSVEQQGYKYLNKSNQNTEIQVLLVKKPNNKGDSIINTYRPPSGNQSMLLDDINSTMIHLVQDVSYLDIYLTRDLNLDHSSNHLTESTPNLITTLKSFGLHQYINQPTRVTANSQTILDVMYIKTSKNIKSFIYKSALSDHYLIGTVRSFDYHSPTKQYINGRSYKDYSFDKAKLYYSWQCCKVIYQENVELAWNRLYKYMLNCADTLCPLRQMLIRQDSPPWITHKIIGQNPQNLLKAKDLRTSTKRDVCNAKPDYIKIT